MRFLLNISAVLNRAIFRASLVSVALLSAAVDSSAEPLPGDLLRAAVIYKLTKFVEWPEGTFKSSNTLTICTMTDDSMSQALRRLHGRVTQGRTILVIDSNESEHASDCHVLVSGSEPHTVSSHLVAARTAAVLTISDTDGFAENKGIIELRENAGRLKFRINLSNARKANLTLSSTLLELAEVVQ